MKSRRFAWPLMCVLTNFILTPSVAERIHEDNEPHFTSFQMKERPVGKESPLSCFTSALQEFQGKAPDKGGEGGPPPLTQAMVNSSVILCGGAETDAPIKCFTQAKGIGAT